MSKYKRRGDFLAEEEHRRLDGETGHWAVVDFTGRFHRPLIAEKPLTTTSGTALVREDRRPNSKSREESLLRKATFIQEYHQQRAAETNRRIATHARVAYGACFSYYLAYLHRESQLDKIILTLVHCLPF